MACKNPVEVDIEPWMEYTLQDGLLCRNSKPCIPKCSMRDNLIQENRMEVWKVTLEVIKPLDIWVISIFGQG